NPAALRRAGIGERGTGNGEREAIPTIHRLLLRRLFLLAAARDDRGRHRALEEEDRERRARGAVRRGAVVFAPRAVLFLEPQELVRSLRVPPVLADLLTPPQDPGALHAVRP